MTKISDFLKKINVESQVLERLSAEDITDDELNTLVDNYNSQRQQFYEASFETTKKKDIESGAITSYNIRVKKELNKILGMGLTNAEMDSFKDMEAFFNKAKEFNSSFQESLKNITDKDLKEQIENYKTSLTNLKNENESLKTGAETFKTKLEQEFADKARAFEARIFIKDMIAKDTELADVPTKAFVLEQIEDTIMSKYKPFGDGRVFNVDESKIMHPEKQVIIENVADLYSFLKNKAGINKQSNGGVQTVQTSGGVVVTGANASAAEQAMLEKIAAARRNSKM